MLLHALIFSCLILARCGFVGLAPSNFQLCVQSTTLDLETFDIGTIRGVDVGSGSPEDTNLSGQSRPTGDGFSMGGPPKIAGDGKLSNARRTPNTFVGSISPAGNELDSPATIAPTGTTIQAPSLRITTTGFPNARVAQFYSKRLGATGGIRPYMWTIVSGQLPPGLMLNATSGVISGTPVQGGQFNLNLRLSDSSSPSALTATTALSLRISAHHTQIVRVLQKTANQVTIQWDSVPKVTSYLVLVDDAPTFVTPIISRTVNHNCLNLNNFDAGFAPGVTYYVRVNPRGSQATFRLKIQAWAEPYLSYSYARAAWENAGRAWMGQFSGVTWNPQRQTWILGTSWSDANSNVAQDAYYLEHGARAAVNMGSVRNDIALLDELAAFYVAYQGRYTTLGAMRSLIQYDTSMLKNSGPDSTKTLIWVYGDGGTTYVRECDLCNSQFYHPVARLLRIITTLPASERTKAMQDFAEWYVPIVTHDHLLRLLGSANGFLVAQIRNSPSQISDLHLWLISEAAEILGANANNPNLVPLTSPEKLKLRQAVQVAVEALKTNHVTQYPDTKDFRSKVVGSVSYFNGEYIARHDPDYAYSGYFGQSFPTPTEAKLQPDASWDISHFYRFPVFLRSLYDNKKAVGVDFPSFVDLRLLLNHLMYKNFQGNFDLPLFNNYFDGSNGWYRVGYHGPHFGYPPAQYCNNSVGPEPCLTTGAVQGWGLIAFFTPDAVKLQHSLATLAWSHDARQIAFRRQYYYYNSLDYSASDSRGRAQYPSLLLWVLAGAAERLQ
jgi:hypothetical protein